MATIAPGLGHRPAAGAAAGRGPGAERRPGRHAGRARDRPALRRSRTSCCSARSSSRPSCTACGSACTSGTSCSPASRSSGCRTTSTCSPPGRRRRSPSGTRCGRRRSSPCSACPLLMVLPLALAVALNKKFRGRNAVRAIFFAPFVLGVAVIGLLWRYLLDPNVGVINYYLDQLGFDRIPFTTATPWVWARPRRAHDLVDGRLQHGHLPRRPAGHLGRAVRGGRARRRERVAAVPPRHAAGAAPGDDLRPDDHDPRVGQRLRAALPHHPGPTGRGDPQRDHADRRGGPAPVQHGQRLGDEHGAHAARCSSSACSACRSCGSALPRRRSDEHRHDARAEPATDRAGSAAEPERRLAHPVAGDLPRAARAALPRPAAVDGDDVAEVHGRGLAGRPHLPAAGPDAPRATRRSSAPRRRRSASGSSTR